MSRLEKQNLNEAQLKGLSQFLNTIGAVWFSAGVVAPFFAASVFYAIDAGDPGLYRRLISRP